MVTFVRKVISLLFNTLSRFVIAFLSRGQCLLIYVTLASQKRRFCVQTSSTLELGGNEVAYFEYLVVLVLLTYKHTFFSLFFSAFFLTSCLYTCYYATPVSPAHSYSTFFSSLILTPLMTQMSAENLELLSFSPPSLPMLLHGLPLQPSSRWTLSLVSSPLFTLQERLSLMFFCCLCLSSFLLIPSCIWPSA